MNNYHVYLVGAKPSGPIKVGFSANCRQRVGYLQTGSHLDLSLIKTWRLTYSNAKNLERAAHKELNEFKLKGEWFSCAPQQALSIIRRIKVKTKNFKNWKLYRAEIRTKSWLDNAASIGGRANAQRAEKAFWQKFAVIADRWHLPSKKENANKPLLAEADVSRNTVKSYLGYNREEWQRLSDAQRERILKRKANAKR
jgi:hypothetical protein